MPHWLYFTVNASEREPAPDLDCQTAYEPLQDQRLLSVAMPMCEQPITWHFRFPRIYA